MKKFKFLFLIALVATMFIGCAQPTVVSVSTAYKYYSNGSVSFFKTASVTYSDAHVDKYEIITRPANVTRIENNYYYVDNVTLLNKEPPSQIDFFNGTSLIVKGNNEIEFKFSEVYTKVE